MRGDAAARAAPVSPGRSGLVVVLVVAGLSIPAGATDRVTDAWDRFTDNQVVVDDARGGRAVHRAGQQRAHRHLGRRLADGFRAEPSTGPARGRTPPLWLRDRPTTAVRHRRAFAGARDPGRARRRRAGAALLALVPLIGALWWRALRDRAPAWAALAAVATAWAARSAVDWDWEMPVRHGVAVRGRGTRARQAGAGAVAARGASASPGGWASPAGSHASRSRVLPVEHHPLAAALIDAQRAVRVGDCSADGLTLTRGDAALSSRPESFELLAWCDVRLGQPQLALARPPPLSAATRRTGRCTTRRRSCGPSRGRTHGAPRAPRLRRNPLDVRAQTRRGSSPSRTGATGDASHWTRRCHSGREARLSVGRVRRRSNAPAAMSIPPMTMIGIAAKPVNGSVSPSRGRDDLAGRLCAGVGRPALRASRGSARSTCSSASCRPCRRRPQRGSEGRPVTTGLGCTGVEYCAFTAVVSAAKPEIAAAAPPPVSVSPVASRTASVASVRRRGVSPSERRLWVLEIGITRSFGSDA